MKIFLFMCIVLYLFYIIFAVENIFIYENKKNYFINN
jgi:hypothetical protein